MSSIRPVGERVSTSVPPKSDARARDQAHLYTDDRARLTAAIGLRDGSQAAALDHDAGFEIGD